MRLVPPSVLKGLSIAGGVVALQVTFCIAAVSKAPLSILCKEAGNTTSFNPEDLKAPPSITFTIGISTVANLEQPIKASWSITSTFIKLTLIRFFWSFKASLPNFLALAGNVT